MGYYFGQLILEEFCLARTDSGHFWPGSGPALPAHFAVKLVRTYCGTCRNNTVVIEINAETAPAALRHYSAKTQHYHVNHSSVTACGLHSSPDPRRGSSSRRCRYVWQCGWAVSVQAGGHRPVCLNNPGVSQPSSVMNTPTWLPAAAGLGWRQVC